MPFNWQAPPSLENGTIGDLMLRGPDALAQAAVNAGRARANATSQNGQIWGNAIANVGQTVAALPQQMQQAKQQEQQTAIRQIQLDDSTRQQQGQKAMSSIMSGGLNPGDAGPKESYLSEDGLFDVKKITASLAEGGFGDQASDLVKGAESINDSILKHQKLEVEAGQLHTLLMGDMADGALKLAKRGMPLDQAIQFVAAPALATKRIKPEELAQVTEHIMSLPPEQQEAALDSLRDAASKLDKGDTLAPDAIQIDRYGRTEAKNPKVPTITPEQAKIDGYIASMGLPNGTTWAQLTPEQRTGFKAYTETEKPPRPLDQQLLEAIAKGDDTAKSNILATIAADANAKRDPVAQAQLESIRNLTQQAARDRLDNEDPQSGKNQQKFEQEYRNVLVRGMSNRSGGLGLEDLKVQQANHLMSIFEQNYDPKTGDWNIPRVQLNELALGLARLTAPGGQAGEQMLKEFQQRTTKGDIAGALTYLTGSPVPANTQAITRMLKDSIERQGKTAEQNREGEMAYMRGLVPTDLNEDRRNKLEATTLNPLRQSRVIQNTATGERKQQVSVDGGKTWR